MRGDLRQSTKYIDWAKQKQYLPRCLYPFESFPGFLPW